MLGKIIPEYGYFYIYLILYLVLAPLALAAFRRWHSAGRAKLIAGNLAVFLFLLMALFVAAEGYFYFFYDTSDGSMILLSSRRWLDRHVKRNPLGFRGKLIPLNGQKAPGELNIAVIGDSFTFGEGIDREEDRYTEVLEKKLRESGIRASVYNLSGLGLNTLIEIELFKFLRDNRAPVDIIILGYVTNDILEPENYTPEYKAARARTDKRSPIIDAVINRSFVLNFLYHRFTTFSDPAYRNYGKMVITRYEDPQILSTHLQDLATVKSLAKEIGARLAVATFPTVRRVVPGIHSLNSHRYAAQATMFAGARFAIVPPMAKLGSWCALRTSST